MQRESPTLSVLHQVFLYTTISPMFVRVDSGRLFLSIPNYVISLSGLIISPTIIDSISSRLRLTAAHLLTNSSVMSKKSPRWQSAINSALEKYEKSVGTFGTSITFFGSSLISPWNLQIYSSDSTRFYRCNISHTTCSIAYISFIPWSQIEPSSSSYSHYNRRS